MKKLTMLMVLLLLGGCAAPPQVQVAQTVKAMALTNYLTNDAKIDGVVVGLWKTARGKEIKATATSATLKAIAAVGIDRAAVDKDGKATGKVVKTLTAEEAVELSGVIHAEIQNANAGTARVLARIQTLRNANAANLARHAELEGALNEYLQAGVEEAVLHELTAYLVETISAQTGKDK